MLTGECEEYVCGGDIERGKMPNNNVLAGNMQRRRETVTFNDANVGLTQTWISKYNRKSKTRLGECRRQYLKPLERRQHCRLREAMKFGCDNTWKRGKESSMFGSLATYKILNTATDRAGYGPSFTTVHGMRAGAMTEALGKGVLDNGEDVGVAMDGLSVGFHSMHATTSTYLRQVSSKFKLWKAENRSFESLSREELHPTVTGEFGIPSRGRRIGMNVHREMVGSVMSGIWRELNNDKQLVDWSRWERMSNNERGSNIYLEILTKGSVETKKSLVYAAYLSVQGWSDQRENLIADTRGVRKLPKEWV